MHSIHRFQSLTLNKIVGDAQKVFGFKILMILILLTHKDSIPLKEKHNKKYYKNKSHYFV